MLLKASRTPIQNCVGILQIENSIHRIPSTLSFMTVSSVLCAPIYAVRTSHMWSGKNTHTRMNAYIDMWSVERLPLHRKIVSHIIFYILNEFLKYVFFRPGICATHYTERRLYSTLHLHTQCPHLFHVNRLFSPNDGCTCLII